MQIKLLGMEDTIQHLKMRILCMVLDLINQSFFLFEGMPLEFSGDIVLHLGCGMSPPGWGDAVPSGLGTCLPAPRTHSLATQTIALHYGDDCLTG